MKECVWKDVAFDEIVVEGEKHVKVSLSEHAHVELMQDLGEKELRTIHDRPLASTALRIGKVDFDTVC